MSSAEFPSAFPPPLRALVVEDDRSWQQILSELLGDAGLAVDVADSLPTALACLRAAPHRLAVVDLSLGGSDHRNQEGLAVLDAIRRHDPGCTPLLLTGYATVELAVDALTKHGAFTCLRKETFRRAEFRQIVRQVLAASPGALSGQAMASRWPTDAQTPLSPHAGPDAPGSSGPPVASPVVSPPPEGTGQPAEPVQAPAPSAAGSSLAQPSSATTRTSAAALVVEDDAGWRSILVELLSELGYTVQACRSFGEALGFLRRYHYALAVIDLSLASSLLPDDNTDGYRLLAHTKKAGIPSIVVSGSALPPAVERAYDEHGIVAYVEKQGFDRPTFRQAVAQAEAAARAASNVLDVLTDREREVLALLVQGLTNKEIAEALVITDNTVKRHLKAIFAKLQVTTRAAAVAKAVSANR